MSEQRAGLFLAGALILCLLAGSTPRIVGDGGEYMAQAMNFAAFNGPALGRQVIPPIQRRIAELSPELSEWDVAKAAVASANGGRDFLHFWFYALLVTPFLWLVTAVGASPIHAFTIANVALFVTALWMAVPRIGQPATLLLFASPIVWWLDKAHTEVFTVSLLTIAMLTLRDRPWWSLVAAGMASTQNPPIAIVVLLILAVEITRRRTQAFADRRFLVCAIAGCGLAVLQPIYTYVRHDTPSLLLYATRPGLPLWAEVSAVITDPSIGLVGNYPLFLVAVIATAAWLAMKHPRAWWTPEMLVASVSTAVFLYSFARTTNTHHGATPSLTRYALWLLPMSIPLWTALRETSGPLGRRLLATGAGASAVLSIFGFHPGVPQNTREPTSLATWLWTQHPSWNNPLPEVFSETLLHVEGTTVPAATDGCEKVLIAASATDDSPWPVPCLPAPLPAHCQIPNALCYANRRGDDYTFVRAPGRDSGPSRVPEATWPRAGESVVRRIYADWGWAAMVDAGPAAIEIWRANHNVRVAPYGNDDRFLMVLRPQGADAVLRFRPAASMTGEIVDVVTGTATPLRFDGAPGDLWNVPLPPAANPLILTMTRGDPSE